MYYKVLDKWEQSKHKNNIQQEIINIRPKVMKCRLKWQHRNLIKGMVFFENKNNIDSFVAKLTTRMKIWISKIRDGKEKITRYANESHGIIGKHFQNL